MINYFLGDNNMKKKENKDIDKNNQKILKTKLIILNIKN